MTHICLIHVVRALEGHETELGALTDANRRRDLINESRDQHKIIRQILNVLLSVAHTPAFASKLYVVIPCTHAETTYST
jgi:hypothetical protein